ncbi:hypothetical protein Ae263Ps1_6026 [Pseudonocardia sp. Ae263_Ps1]|nr:hypothetical protein Ae263Ps1_6026 [Pseudonocardia sp. Ae263_Ps1]
MTSYRCGRAPIAAIAVRHSRLLVPVDGSDGSGRTAAKQVIA